MIRFNTKPFIINDRMILSLPRSASSELPSRGQVMVTANLNGYEFMTALEPDGAGSHWFELSTSLQKKANVKSNSIANLSITATKDWPEPFIPSDIDSAIVRKRDTRNLWTSITPMARWEWIRWIGATNQAETRGRRISTARSKLLAGERRPCCFNRSVCCVPDVSKNGVLQYPQA